MADHLRNVFQAVSNAIFFLVTETMIFFWNFFDFMAFFTNYPLAHNMILRNNRDYGVMSRHILRDMANLLLTFLEFAFILIVYPVNKLFIFTWNLLCRYHGVSVYRSTRRHGPTIGEEDAEEFATLNLKHFEDSTKQAIYMTGYDKHSHEAFKVLILQKKKVGVLPMCYLFKRNQRTNVVKMRKMPSPITVNEVLEFF